MRRHPTKLLIEVGALALAALPYLAYVGFLISLDQGPVDFETFRRIGQTFLAGGPVYGENSYYPLPFVLVFAGLALLPKGVSLALWLLAPVVAALAISRWQPWVLLFAPVASHFFGGQTALFGLLGLWGYRRWCKPESFTGGAWLALTLLKPQLGIVPVGYAAYQWWRYWREQRRLPRQLGGLVAGVAATYGPAFLIWPTWPAAWLSHPRPLFERAMSGLIPRALLSVAPAGSWAYWLLWLALSLALIGLVWRLKLGRPLGLTAVVLLGFIISPLVHDYDLLQLVPLIDTRRMRWGAVLLSLPGWLVIILAYAQDWAWFVFTLIAPGLLAIWLYEQRRAAAPEPLPEAALPAATPAS